MVTSATSRLSARSSASAGGRALPYPVSDHCDGRCFFNPQARARRTLADLLSWARSPRPRPWPRWIENRARPALPLRLRAGELALTFVNHITFLIQLRGINVLTDPVYSQRVSPLRRFGPKRVRAPGLAFEHLPRIDLVLISHNHYDHLDVDTLRRLQTAHRPRFITGLGNRLLLERIGLRRVHELDWWQQLDLPDATVTMTPAQHWSRRGLRDRNRTLWGGFHVRGRDGSVYFAGDTGYCAHFRDIRRRLGPPDLALLPIGAYAPRWIEAPHHMDPEEAVRAHLELAAPISVATHFGCFRLSDEGIDEPVIELGAARARHGVSDQEFQVLETGETRKLQLARRLPASALAEAAA